ncbi:interleukin-1 receptor-like 1 isoform X2 [Pimephales promelas]|uniref:interleukin-1 receptor-like 1 isoform X2 n=1 Tax=Pimephales promelas TaxID=90988 RepID=UPI0019557CD5|nr:interleukin-1 receptor-like 1 isoform X2 [Pimephales promelas]
MTMMMMMMRIILLLSESVLVSYQSNSTVQCELGNRKSVRVRAGESLYFPCPSVECYESTEGYAYDWWRNLSRTNQTERIGTAESERVHYHQSVLYILWLTLDDTGLYITRWWYEKDKCDEYETDIVVYEAFHTDLLYSPMVEEKAIAIYCPVCENQQAAFLWYKNFSLIPNQESKRLPIRNSSKESEGIYTCVCTWEHNGLKHNTSGHRRLIIKAQSVNNPPVFQLPVNNSVVITDVGTELILVCSVFFVCDECPVLWQRNKTTLREDDGYKQENRAIDGSVQSLLYITKVSELDLVSEFRCRTKDSYRVMFVSVTLKSRASTHAVILACICTFLLVLVLSGTVKWFSLDLVLFLREIPIKFNRKEDGKLYDAYVIYQRNSDETTSKTIA